MKVPSNLCLLWLLCLLSSTNSDETDLVDCGDGACPTPEETTDTNSSQQHCGLWMGPSPIKEHQEHGFGLGIFTGHDISNGTVISPEVLIPFYDYDDAAHQPIREYMWMGYVSMELVLESYSNLLLFLPGIAAMAPCTSQNYNMEQIHRIESIDRNVNSNSHSRVLSHRGQASAGSFSHRRDAMFTAVRDIVAGEELTVECSDDDFDGGGYLLSRYDATDDRLTCLDDTVVVRPSTIPNIGMGVFAKRAIQIGEVILSSPVLPVHIYDLMVNHTNVHINDRQLLMNYCFTHPDSNLLMLPFGPMMNYLNHAPPPSSSNSAGDVRSNTRNSQIAWHEFKGNDELHRRQQYHHPELLSLPPWEVARTHGKGLMMDLIATTDIQEGEEIFLHYGDKWVQAYDTHVKNYATFQKLVQEADHGKHTYVPAEEFHRTVDTDVVRTVMEQQQDPYPFNLHTTCRYWMDWVDPEEDEEGLTTLSWNAHENHDCLLPCIIIDRSTSTQQQQTYTAKLMDTAHSENTNISWDCHLHPQYEYLYVDIPRHGIQILDKPYTADAFQREAFREPMGVPEGMYPFGWLKPRVRRRRTGEDAGGKGEENDGEEFKRKKIVVDPPMKADKAE